jgi:hypothetical protein
MKPTVGRIVHFVMPGNSQHRPAIIVRVWSEQCVNLQVFTDCMNDLLPDGGQPAPGVLWVTSASYQEPVANQTDGPRTWHWPEREG